MRVMALPSVWRVMRVAIPFISVVGLLSVRLVGASQDSGSVIPAESRPCVDCHAFEFMQRALQDLKKTAYNLDTRLHSHGKRDSKATCGECNQFTATSPSDALRCPLSACGQCCHCWQTETLLLRAEKRGLCDCFHAIH